MSVDKKSFWAEREDLRVLSQYKDRFSRLRDTHYKAEMVMRPFYLYNGNPIYQDAILFMSVQVLITVQFWGLTNENSFQHKCVCVHID